MEITERLYAKNRNQWREWLAENHSIKREIWVSTSECDGGLSYLDAVEEALCFGWIDSTIKSGVGVMWRRFSPRRPRSLWTELNKERCRRLERLGLMTDAGRAVLPNMDFRIEDDVLAALQSDDVVWQNFQTLHPLYVRVRIDNIQNMRKRNFEVFQRRLQKFIDNTRSGVIYGDWHDGGRLLSADDDLGK
jgi:uncharacterized protein YdeI (YjbR/CyaY-like superfamily)